MPEIDHGVSQKLQAKMMKTDPLKPQQKSLEFILPGKYTLYRSKAFLKNFLIIKSLSPPFGLFTISRIFFDVRNHASIENLLPILSTIVSRIKADNTPLKSFSHTLKDVLQECKGFAKQRTFMTIARSNCHGR